MEEPHTPSPAARLQSVAERPARLINTICQMILGAGFAVTLIVKVYMAVLTDHACAADAVSLGNTIRCTSVLELMASVLALSAGFDLAYRLFGNALDRSISPVILAAGAALLYLFARIASEPANWRSALVVAALLAALGALVFLRERMVRRPETGSMPE